jgi:SAM-dependent methyltransferase
MPSLLLGCGDDRRKKLQLAGAPEWTGELTTIDMNPDCGADIVHNLDSHPLPFEDDTFDELAAYDVLEHLGRQGDWRGYFDEFAEYWRILKPGGTFGIIVPIGADALADVGHTRFFSGNAFCCLSQKWYAANKGSMSFGDYRWYWKRDFDVVFLEQIENHHLATVLRKVT